MAGPGLYLFPQLLHASTPPQPLALLQAYCRHFQSLPRQLCQDSSFPEGWGKAGGRLFVLEKSFSLLRDIQALKGRSEAAIPVMLM